jgi:hypothetical protein
MNRTPSHWGSTSPPEDKMQMMDGGQKIEGKWHPKKYQEMAERCRYIIVKSNIEVNSNSYLDTHLSHEESKVSKLLRFFAWLQLE